MADVEKIRCDACPVLCQITEGRSGACDRYANVAGALTRVDPVLLMRRASDPDSDGPVVRFAGQEPDWDGDLVGQSGFRAVVLALPRLVREHDACGE